MLSHFLKAQLYIFIWLDGSLKSFNSLILKTNNYILQLCFRTIHL